jgi:hypothetical protein
MKLKNKITLEKPTVILTVKMWFCVLCSTLLLPVSFHFVNRTAHMADSGYFTSPRQFAELNKTVAHTDESVISAKQIINKKFKVPSQLVKAIKNNTRRLIEVEIIRNSETDNGTVKLLKTRQETGRGKFSDIHPKASAPP